MPMSWPKSTTSGSSMSARASARLTASTRVSSAMALSNGLGALARVGSRELRIKIVEYRFRSLVRGIEMTFDGGIDLMGDLLGQSLLLLLAPHTVALHKGAQPAQRTTGALLLDFLGISIPGGIIGGVV